MAHARGEDTVQVAAARSDRAGSVREGRRRACCLDPRVAASTPSLLRMLASVFGEVMMLIEILAKAER